MGDEMLMRLTPESRHRSVQVVGPAGAAAAGREQVRALFVNRNGGAAAGGGRAQAVVDEIDLTQQLVDEPVRPQPNTQTKSPLPAAHAMPGASVLLL